MFKYLLKCALNITLCAAVAAGAAAAFGVEYKLLAGKDGGEAVVSYEKISDSEGRLTLGQYAFTLDLGLLDNIKEKLGQYADSAVSYLPDLAVKAGGYIRNIAVKLTD